MVTLFADVDSADSKNEKHFAYYANRMRKVAQDYKGRIVFNIANKNLYGRLLDIYRLTALKDSPRESVAVVVVSQNENMYA